MTVKRGYFFRGGAVVVLFGVLLIQNSSALAPAPINRNVLGAQTGPKREDITLIQRSTARSKAKKLADGNQNSNTTEDSELKRTLALIASAGVTSPPSLIKNVAPGKLIWQQVFSQISSLDSSFWNIADPSLPIYNNEAQKYYNRSRNVRIENGNLVLEAHKESDGSFSSGRVDTRGKQIIEVGTRLEARIKLPHGKGTWPAFWLLSDNQPYTTPLNPTDADWQKPRFYLWNGEIDIVEAYGGVPNVVEATTHTYKKTSSGSALMPSAFTGFQTYWMEWRSNKLTFGVDDKILHNLTATSGSPADWPFTSANRMYVILNLAMGGTGGGSISQQSSDNWKMEIAWVKYFKLSE